MKKMRNEPFYKTTPTMRDYESYVRMSEYTNGWNDAMDYIFPEEKLKREKEKKKSSFTVIEKDN